MIHNKKYKTNPVIIHNPYLNDGWSKELFWNAVQNMQPKYCEIPKDLTVITWNNSKNLSILESQLNFLNISHVVLGKEIIWTSNRLKPKTFLDHEFNTKYVLGMDAYDVKIISDLKSIIDKFKLFNTHVLFNATSTMWPDDKKDKCIEKSIADEPFCFFNSGVFIGEVDYIKKMFSSLNLDDPRNKFSDQFLIRKEYHRLYPEIQIDWQCQLFQITDTKNYKIEDFIKLKWKIYL